MAEYLIRNGRLVDGTGAPALTQQEKMLEAAE